MNKPMKCRCGIKAAALLAAVSVSAGAKTVDEEIKEARAAICSNSVHRGTRSCAYYKAWFADLCSEAERDAILERNIAAHRRWQELSGGSNAAAHAGLGCVFAAVGRWDEARIELAAAIAAGEKLDVKSRSDVLWEMANCLWQAGDRDGAKKLLDEVAAMKWSANVPDSARRAQYLSAMMNDSDYDTDVFRLPHSVDGRPFPMPQKAEYGDGRVSLAKVEIKASGTGATEGTGVAGLASPARLAGHSDSVFRLLKRKLQRFGSEFAPGGTAIELSLSPDAPVDKPQGYSLEVANGSVCVRARTRLGLLWGAVSFLQCVDRDALAIRELRIEDWPVCEKRGIIDYWDPWILEYALFYKMSSVVVRMDSDWTLSPLDRERYRIWGERFGTFGIEMYCGSSRIAMTPLLPLASERTWKFHLAWARFAASCGMSVSFHLDDFRFPVHPFDLAAAGSAANLDAKYMTKLYRAVKAEHPGFKFLYCPPFYWGPDSPAAYPEPREPYLKSLGEFLDPEIDVYWTGPRVKSENMTHDRVKWYSGLIGRKPSIFHNCDCVRRHNCIRFGADATGFKASHPPTLFDDIARFYQNTDSYGQASEIGSAMDWCWNPAAHDPEIAVRRAVEQMEGPGVSEIVAAATPSLSYFDKYAFGRPSVELLAEDPADLDRRVQEAEDAWRRVVAVAKNGGVFVSGFNLAAGWARKLAATRRDPPDRLRNEYEAAMANTVFAEKEVGFDRTAGDQFVPGSVMRGGKVYNEAIRDSAGEARAVKFIETGMEASGEFVCEPFPNPRPFKMLATGMRFLDRWEKPPKVDPPELEVEVNGRVIWRGAMFAEDLYKTVEIEIPVDAIRRSNVFTIRNPGPYVKNQGRPVVNYVVFRK